MKKALLLIPALLVLMLVWAAPALPVEAEAAFTG